MPVTTPSMQGLKPLPTAAPTRPPISGRGVLPAGGGSAAAPAAAPAPSLLPRGPANPLPGGGGGAPAPTPAPTPIGGYLPPPAPAPVGGRLPIPRAGGRPAPPPATGQTTTDQSGRTTSATSTPIWDPSAGRWISQQSRTETSDPNQSTANVVAREGRQRDDRLYDEYRTRASMEMLAQQGRMDRSADIARDDRLIDQDYRLAREERRDDEGFNRQLFSLIEREAGGGPAADLPPREPGISLPPRIGDPGAPGAPGDPASAGGPVRAMTTGGGLRDASALAAPAADSGMVAEQAAYARAKDRIGKSMRGAVDSLRDEFGGTGAIGAQAKALGSVVAAGQGQLAETDRDIALEGERRRQDVEDRDYEGELTRRGQDIGQRGQDVSLLGTGYGGGITQRGQDIAGGSDRRNSMLALAGMFRNPASLRRY